MDPAVAWFQDEQKGPSQRTWDKIWGTVQEMENNKEAANSIDAPGGGGAVVVPAANPKTAKEMNMLLDRNGGPDASASRTPLGTRDATSNTGAPTGGSATTTANSSTTTPNNTNTSSSSGTTNGAERTYYNPSRRKAAASQLDTNRASTFNMNRYQQRLVGKHGGCPWRPACFKYGRGIVG